MNRFEAFRDMDDKWRWRLIGAGERVIATSPITFQSRADAVKVATIVKAEAAEAAVSEIAGIGPKEVIAELIRREDARRLEVAGEAGGERRPEQRRPTGGRRKRIGTGPRRLHAVGSRRPA